MSGTSMDGVDLSLVKTDGQKIKRCKKNFFLSYKQSTKDALKKITSETNFNKTALNYFDKIITDEYIRALKASKFVNLCDVLEIKVLLVHYLKCHFDENYIQFFF